MLSEDKKMKEKKKETAPISVPVEIFPPFPRAADREVWYFTVFYLSFFSIFGPLFLFSFYECRRRPLAPSYGMSFCCLSDPTGRISPGPVVDPRDW